LWVLRLLRRRSLTARSILLLWWSRLFPARRRRGLFRKSCRRRSVVNKRRLNKIVLQLHRLHDGRFLSRRWRGDFLDWLFHRRFVKDIEIEVIEIIEITADVIHRIAHRWPCLRWRLSGFGLKILQVCPKRIEPIIITSKRIINW
jgi:hypothetical protein